MPSVTIPDFSIQLKALARDLSFLGRPRYPLKRLLELFPQHQDFLSSLQDMDTPFSVNTHEKRQLAQDLLKSLELSGLPSLHREIFQGRIHDYLTLISMMENFGTPLFYEGCKKLYGSSFASTLDHSLYRFLELAPQGCRPESKDHLLSGDEALAYLQRRMSETFSPDDFEVKPSTSLLSDSSAGRRSLKLNPLKSYSTDQLEIFLVHEGWVHLGTSINGARHAEELWPSTWAPRTTPLQEGLAILVELLTGKMTLERWNKVMLRHLATMMAERGSNIVEVYEYLRHHELADLDALKLSLRIFRGVPLEGGMAFTKELLYLQGLIQLLGHLDELASPLSTLWVGKLSFKEHRLLFEAGLPLKAHFFPQELNQESAKEKLAWLIDLARDLFTPGSSPAE